MIEADIHLRLLPTSILDIQSVLAICMMSQGPMGAPLCRYTHHVGPRFGNSGSLLEWTWCHHIMFEADIHIKLIFTSKLDTNKVIDIEPLVYAVSSAYSWTLIPLHWPSWPKMWEFRFTREVKMMSLHHGWGWYPPQTPSILDVNEVFEPLLCCLKGIWVHPSTIPLPLAKLAPDLGIQVHLWSAHDVITACLMLISTSDSFSHPYFE